VMFGSCLNINCIFPYLKSKNTLAVGTEAHVKFDLLTARSL
jgi:hypothetical protein